MTERQLDQLTKVWNAPLKSFHGRESLRYEMRRALATGCAPEHLGPVTGVRVGGIVVVANGQKLGIDAMNREDADDIAHAIQDRSSGRQPGPALPPWPVADDLGNIKRWRLHEELEPRRMIAHDCHRRMN
jgi:hypothetical protein